MNIVDYLRPPLFFLLSFMNRNLFPSFFLPVVFSQNQLTGVTLPYYQPVFSPPAPLTLPKIHRTDYFLPSTSFLFAFFFEVNSQHSFPSIPLLFSIIINLLTPKQFATFPPPPPPPPPPTFFDYSFHYNFCCLSFPFSLPFAAFKAIFCVFSSSLNVLHPLPLLCLFPFPTILVLAQFPAILDFHIPFSASGPRFNSNF